MKAAEFREREDALTHEQARVARIYFWGAGQVLSEESEDVDIALRRAFDYVAVRKAPCGACMVEYDVRNMMRRPASADTLFCPTCVEILDAEEEVSRASHD